MSDNFDIILQARLDKSSEAIDKLNSDVAYLDKKVGKKVSDSILLKTRLDRSEETIQQLTKDIGTIERRLKSTKIGLSVTLDRESIKNIQDSINKIKITAPRVNLNASMPDTNIPNLNSQKFKIDLDTGLARQQIETFRNSILETQRIITSFQNGTVSNSTLEIDSNKVKAQKEVYAEIKRLQDEIFIIDKEIAKTNNSEILTGLNRQKTIREGMMTDARKLIDVNNLSNKEKENELRLLKESQNLQLRIANIKDRDTRSSQVYNELNRLVKEEFSIKQKMVGLDGERLSIQQRLLMNVLQTQDGLKSQLNTSGLHNKEKENQLLRERDRLYMELLNKESQISKQEGSRVQKLGSKVQDVDVKGIGFENKDGIKQYVQDVYGANAVISSFEQRIDSAGRRMYQMTVTTEASANKLKQHKVVVDENSQAMYKMSESVKTNVSRMSNLIDKMGSAISNSIKGALATQLLSENLRRLKEGIEFVKELDKELTQVAIGTGQTREQVRELALEYAELGTKMGKSVSEISRVNTELVRQGLPLDESKSRMDTILKLSAVGALDTERTTSIITSSVNALQTTAEKAGDVLVYTGQLTASSVEEVGDALTRTASSAQATGVSIEELSAILATLTEVTQESPQTLGNSMKTLLSRFNKIDELTGELNQDFNKVQEAFEKVGVTFLDGEGQIRPFYDLLTDLNGMWKDLDKNTKMFIATNAAGAQHQNRFLAVMDNFNRVQELNGDLMNSNGKLNEGYATYLDSVEASANRAKASLEEMWIKSIDSDYIKMFYDASTAITQFLGNLNVLKLGLTAVITTMIMSNKQYQTFTQSFRQGLDLKAFHLLSGKFKEVDTAVKAGRMSLINFNGEIITSSTTTSVFGGALTYVKSQLNLTSVALVASRVAVIALQTALTMGLSFAITMAIEGIMKLIGNSQKAKMEMENLASEVKSSIQSHQDNIKTLSELSEEYDTLNSKIGENGDITKLTAEEQERYNQVSSELARIAPEVVKKIDDKGNAIIEYKTNVEDLIEKEKELIELDKYKLASKEDDIVKDANKEIGDKEQQISRINEEIKANKELIRVREDAINNNNHLSKDKTAEYRQDIADYRLEIIKLQGEHRTLSSEIDDQKDKQKELLDVYFLEVDALDKVGQSMKDMVKEKVNDTFDFMGYDKAKDEVGQYIYILEQLQTTLDNTDAAEVENTFNSVSVQLEKMGLSTKDAETFLLEFVRTSDLTTESMEKLNTTIGFTSTKFMELKDKVMKIADAFAKLRAGQSLSAEELVGLIEENASIAEYIAETGDLTLQSGELLLDLKKQLESQTYNELTAEQKKNKEALEAAQKELDAQDENLKLVKKIFTEKSLVYKGYQQKVEDSKKSVERLGNEHDIAAAKLKALGTVMGETFRENDLKSFQDGFKDATSKLDAYNDILREIDEKGSLSGETNRKIVTDHQELIWLLGNEGEMRKYLMELIQEQQKVQIEMYKRSLDSSDKFSQAVFNSNRDLYNSLANLYDMDLKNFSNLQQLKARLAQETSRVISEAKMKEIRAGSSTELEVAQKELAEIRRQKAEYGSTPSTAPYKKPSLGSKDFFQNNSFSNLLETTKRKELDRAEQAKILQIQALEERDALFNTTFNSGVSFDKAPSFSKSTKATASRSKMENIELKTNAYLKFEKALEEVNQSLERNNQLLDFAINEDKINLLAKEVDLLREKQKVLHLTANAYRAERDSLRNSLSKTLYLEDGTKGIDSFNSYTKQVESQINGLISQINKTTSDATRDSLTEQKDNLKKVYDKVKEDFERYIDIEINIVPQLSTDWIEIEFEKFNKTLEMLDIHYEKYSDRIDIINDRIIHMLRVREDNKKELEDEYKLLKDMSEIYKESLIDVEKRIELNRKNINEYESYLKNISDIQSDEYKITSRILIQHRAEQEKLLQIQKDGLNAYANHMNTVIDKYVSQMNYAKNETIKALEDIRKKIEGFSKIDLEISVDKILAELDKIDKVFIKNPEFNLSTSKARRDLSDWKSDILDTVKEIEKLKEKSESIMKEVEKINKTTVSSEKDRLALEEKLEKEKEKLVKITEEQIKKDNELKDLQESLRIEIEETTLEYKKIEDALENKINLKEEELKQLQKQFEQENRIRQMLEKQLELMRALDDTRHTYITGQGEEIFTYDRGKVSDLQKEVANMTREKERQDMIDKLQEEINQMKEDLSKTKEINAQQLKVLEVAKQSVDNILGVLNTNISDNMGEKGLDKIYKSFEDAFIDGIKKVMESIAKGFEQNWSDFFSRTPIQQDSNDPRQINQDKLDPPKFDTGGYTANSEGLAVLHKKELVLNAQDTKNMLEAVKITDSFANLMPSGFTNLGSETINNNSKGGDVVLNNPVFNEVQNMSNFTNEMSKLLRRGMPNLS